MADDLGTTVEALVELVVISDRMIIDMTLEGIRRASERDEDDLSLSDGHGS